MATPKKPAAKSTKAAKSEKADAAADKPAHVPPVVNLTNAAQSAASFLANRAKRAAAGPAGSSGNVNAATFKQMKDNLAQTQHASTSPLAGLNKAAKPTGSPGFMKQVGHGQAGGANVARTGVPRRTSGG